MELGNGLFLLMGLASRDASTHPYSRKLKLEPSKTKSVSRKFGSIIAFTISFVLKISRERLSFVRFPFSSRFCRLLKTWGIDKKQWLHFWQKVAELQDTQAHWQYRPGYQYCNKKTKKDKNKKDMITFVLIFLKATLLLRRNYKKKGYAKYNWGRQTRSVIGLYKQ